MRLIAYARASTEDQQLTLAAQEAKLRDYCRVYDHEIAEMVVGSESGKSIDGRGEFTRVLDLLRKDGTLDGLLVLKIDRLTRDVGDGVMLLKTYFGEDSQYGKHLFSVQDYIDTRTAAGRCMFSMLLVFAQFEREQIVERTKAALQHKIANLQRVGEVRYGWNLADDGKTLQPNAAEQEVINLMRQLRRDGQSFAAIADHLNARGIKTKKGREWHRRSVNRILNRIAE